MRFTFIMPTDDLSGGNRVVAIYAKQLRLRGHQVLVVNQALQQPSLRERFRASKRAWRARQWSAMAKAWLHQKTLPGHVAQSGVPQRVLARSGPITATDLPDADWLIATWWETALWMDAMPASKGRKAHLIQDYEVWAGGSTPQSVHAALRLPNCKIVISNELKRTLDHKVGDLGLVVVPNAVDLQQFNAPARTRHAVPTVGFMYGHSPRKAADILTQACELARQQLPALRVLAFGADQPIAELPLPSGTEFFHRPAQQQLASLYSRCDAWLFGSRIDSFGLPILEAMACRTPVIGVPVGAAPELLADGAGLLVAPESAQAMATAIVALCTLPADQWQSMSDRAYDRAHNYSWDDATALLLQALAGYQESTK
ncbi:MAG: glycosyltransferase family 4 protein [Burkholderiaceae bacterium]